jgi:DNA-binding response OmpR family regulator
LKIWNYNFLAVKLLIVEDNVKLAETLKRGFAQNGFVSDIINDGQDGLDQIEISHEDYDLVVLDVMLPSKNGMEICKQIRDEKIAIPVLMLTAKDSVSDKVLGLNSGADDYMIKPFEFAELLARVKTILRRPQDVCLTKIAYKGVIMDPGSRVVYKQGEALKLTPKEYEILEYFMRNPGIVLTREMILSHIWDQSFDSFSNVVDVHVANLNKKVISASHEKFIEAVRGAGYRLIR